MQQVDAYQPLSLCCWSRWGCTVGGPPIHVQALALPDDAVRQRPERRVAPRSKAPRHLPSLPAGAPLRMQCGICAWECARCTSSNVQACARALAYYQACCTTTLGSGSDAMPVPAGVHHCMLGACAHAKHAPALVFVCLCTLGCASACSHLTPIIC